MAGLADILRERITREGPLTVAEYMTAALGHPQYGYYMTRDPFGRAGDFITAPEVSQMFGELLGLWAAAVWQSMGGPNPLHLIELGPGRGTLMADALRAIRQAVPIFFESLDVALVEMSPVLRDRQQQTLCSFQDAVQISWHDSLDTLPAGPRIVIANEFFDALPVRQYERQNQQWCERLVGLDRDGGLCFTLSAPLSNTAEIPMRLRNEPAGSIIEDCPVGAALIQEIAQQIGAQGGACLIIDYGHSVQGAGDTLQAVRKQRYYGILDDPGEADLTAHVDFQALADMAKTQGARIFGPVTQGFFLERLGIRPRAEMLLVNAASEQQALIRSALERLIGADEMGTLFKVLVIADPRLAPPPGFD